MDCFKCQKPFDRRLQIPRLLINCGHSICELCASRLLEGGSIKCPDCGTSTDTPSISSLPINQALVFFNDSLLVQNAQITRPSPSSNTSYFSTSENSHTNFSLVSPKSQPKATAANGSSTISEGLNKSIDSVGKKEIHELGRKCRQHNKNIEAYCMNDLELLCVNCIIEGNHKAHEIHEIDKVLFLKPI